MASGQHDNTRYRKIRGNHPNRWRAVHCPVGGTVVKRTWYRNGWLLQDTDPIAAYQGPGLYRCVLQYRNNVKAVAMINVTRNYTIEAHNEDAEDDMVTPYQLNACKSEGVVVKDADARDDGVIEIIFNQPDDDDSDTIDDTVILDDTDIDDGGDDEETHDPPIRPPPPTIDSITNNTEQPDTLSDGHMNDHTTTIIVTCVTICGLIGIIGVMILLSRKQNRKHLPANVRRTLERLLTNDNQHVNHLPDSVL